MIPDIDAFIRSLPAGTTRVRVLSSQGAMSYRKLDELRATDSPILGPTGFPVTMRGHLGRPGGATVSAVTPIMALSHLASTLPSLPVVTAVAIPSLPSTSAGGNDPDVDKVEHTRQKRRKRHDRDSLLREVKRNPSADCVFDILMLGLAEESEMIEFERDRLSLTNQTVYHLTDQRVKVIKTMADAWLKRRSKPGTTGVDLDSPAFATVFAFTLETVRSAMEDAGLRAEFIETVFAKLSKRLTDDWRNEARLRLREKAIA